MIEQTTAGPFFVDDWGDYFYVLSEAGVRMCETDDRSKAQQMCAALNAVHFLGQVMGKS